MHCGLVVIPKTVTEKRIIENLNSTKITLDDNDIQQLANIDRKLRLFNQSPTLLPKGMTPDDIFDDKSDDKFVVKIE